MRQKLSREERRERNHRLIVRGAVFESIVPEAKTMTDEEAAALLRLTELLSARFHNILCSELPRNTRQNELIPHRQNHQNSGKNFVHFVKSFSGIFLKKSLQFPEHSCIIATVVTLIAVKREVAA